MRIIWTGSVCRELSDLQVCRQRCHETAALMTTAPNVRVGHVLCSACDRDVAGQNGSRAVAAALITHVDGVWRVRGFLLRGVELNRFLW